MRQPPFTFRPGKNVLLDAAEKRIIWLDIRTPVQRCLAVLASGLIAAGGFAAENKSPLAPDPRCIEQEMKNGHDQAAAELICRNRKKYQNRIRLKPREEPVEMTVGSPPMISDDTDTPGPNNWEINIEVSGDVSGDLKSFKVPVLDINYGIGEKLQLKIEVPYEIRRTAGFDDVGNEVTSTLRGIANTTVGVKYRLYDNEESGLSAAFYPQIEFRTPGARLEADGGTAAPGTIIAVPVLLTWEFAHVAFATNARIERSSENARADYFASIGVGTRLSDKLAILSEIAGRELGRGDDRRILLNVGLRRKISDREALVASAGGDLWAGGDGQRHFYFTMAYQRFIENNKKK